MSVVFCKEIFQQDSLLDAVRRRADSESQVVCLLFGQSQGENHVCVWSMFVCQDDNFLDTRDRLLEALPAGLDFVGILEATSDAECGNSGAADELCDSDHLKLTCSVDALLNADVSLFGGACNMTNVDLAELRQRTITLVVRWTQQLTLFESDKGFSAAITSELSRLRNELSDNQMAFVATDGGAMLSGSAADDSTTAFDLWSRLHSAEKRKQLSLDTDFLQFETYRRATSESACERLLNCAPIIYSERGSFRIARLELTLRGLAVCQQDCPLDEVFGLLVESLRRQLTASQRALLTYLAGVKSNVKKLPRLSTLAFAPPSLSHWIQLQYPGSRTDADLAEERGALHKLFNLPLSRPLLRWGNARALPPVTAGYLRDVHTFVKAGGAVGERSVVRGSYDYHHYMQDGVADDGWGCAYRSFQTLWSWLRLQGYTHAAVPSHQHIQQALVDVGDKPASFVGSKQWVGSLELSFCLDHLLGLHARILRAESGAEMCGHARQLAAHFDAHGAPVMIGGGVLAHTILGVDFNEQTGDARFLVLDPHYTGAEHVKTIISKGWCGWKPATFWKADSFYNMLLPQLPHGV